MEDTKRKKGRRTIVMDDSLWGRLKAGASRRDISISHLIREWTRDYLRKDEKNVRVKT